MATLLDVNTALAALRSAGGTLEAASKDLYAKLIAAQSAPPAAASAADLDAVVAQITQDTTDVNTAIAAVTAATPAPAV